jgi:hypothetical protein
MNGRVQDPVLGRFISADPFVQAPYNGQSLNRYSYVWNNPLSLVDPSGFNVDDEVVITASRLGNPFSTWIFNFPLPSRGMDLLTNLPVGQSGEEQLEEVVVTAQCVPGAGGVCNDDRALFPLDNAMATCVPCGLAVPVAGYLLWKLGQDMAAAAAGGSGDGTAPENSLDVSTPGTPNPDNNDDKGDDEVWKITITEERFKHVAQRHIAGGHRTAGKSQFFGNADHVRSLIKASERVRPVPQAGGNFERIVDAGRTIGFDRATGEATTRYTVITNRAGTLVTAFPGVP